MPNNIQFNINYEDSYMCQSCFESNPDNLPYQIIDENLSWDFHRCDYCNDDREDNDILKVRLEDQDESETDSDSD